VTAEDALGPQVKGQVLAGIYRHYKGPIYLVLGLAHDANAERLYVPTSRTSEMADGGFRFDFEQVGEREVVVYVALQQDGAKSGPALAVRTREDFEAWLHPAHPERLTMTAAQVDRLGTRMVREDGYVPRFEYVGPVR
jgi:hypothetical protein